MGLSSLKKKPLYREMNGKNEYKTVEISADTVFLLKRYCVFKGISMREYATQVLEEKLKGFKEQLLRMGRLSKY